MSVGQTHKTISKWLNDSRNGMWLNSYRPECAANCRRGSDRDRCSVRRWRWWGPPDRWRCPARNKVWRTWVDRRTDRTDKTNKPKYNLSEWLTARLICMRWWEMPRRRAQFAGWCVTWVCWGNRACTRRFSTDGNSAQSTAASWCTRAERTANSVELPGEKIEKEKNREMIIHLCWNIQYYCDSSSSSRTHSSCRPFRRSSKW